MKKIEYLVKELYGRRNEEETLEFYGKRGWELVQMLKEDDCYIYYFKRDDDEN